MIIGGTLEKLYGLPVFSFPGPSGTTAELPGPDAVAWRIATGSYDAEEAWEAAFARFCAQVDTTRVRALIVGAWEDAYDSAPSEAVQALLAARDRLPALRSVFLGDITSEECEISWINQTDVTPLLAGFPALEEFGVRGGQGLEFPALRHEALRSLTMETGGLPVEVVRGVGASELPALEHLDLWCTYHPGQTPYDRFLAKSHELARLGVRFSVGIVGLSEHLEAARRLRAELPEQVYLWVNAAEGRMYDDAEADLWTALDPLFGYSRHPHASAGLPCRTGESVISVDGEGTVRRCHFVRTELGNLYDGSYRQALAPRACPLTSCDCHIGYVHLETLPLYDVFAGGVLERVPATPARREPGDGTGLPRDSAASRCP
ncbi:MULTISPECIES: STM4011 family radical SAM protein [unclassified Streptomyces]|uniref:STM4011 family radical SAM protein n=1 Tax=unclassified Streptomyces TaxID=2593676 RepID=UPI00073C5E63|nr:STM4011 family radical SAM protein [Streptomyces sp. AVP053U2]ODA72300.1 hypothetical protein APS67_003477 [Streptomyces sp. AVP053U2]